MTKYARMSNDFCSGMYGILASIWFRAIEWVFDLVVRATWCPLREFNYFRHISDVALEAGASIDDCENSDIRVTFSGGGMIHSLIHSVLFSEDVVFSDAKAMKFELFMAYFVEVGFSIEYRNFGGETPFLNAAKRHRSYSRTLLQILLEQGANPTAKDNKGRGALHLAIENFWEDTNSLDFDKADNSGSNDDDASESGGAASLEKYPGEGAIRWTVPEWYQLLKDELLFLLQAGCDPGAEDNDGFTVNDYAETEGLSGAWELVFFNFNAEQQKKKT